MVKIEQIIKPFSSGFTAVSTKLLIEDLTRRYIATEHDITVKAFKENRDYFIHAMIPSKTNDKYGSDTIYYDAVIQLIPPNFGWQNNDNIRDWDVRVFCNNPSFMFNFTYVYHTKNALIKLPNGYYSKLALKHKPKVRNPLLLLGIDETLWFTVMYMDKHKLFDHSNIDNLCNSNIGYTVKDLIKVLSTQENKLKEINDRGARHRSNENVKKEKEKLSKFEEEKLKLEKRKNTLERGKSIESQPLYTDKLAMTNVDDLSSNLKTYNKSTLSVNKKKSNLRSSL